MPPPSLERRSLLILTASVTGTAVDIAERIGRTARRHGWSAAVKDVDQFDRTELLETPLIVFVMSTTGDGTAPPSFTPLWNSLLHTSLPSDLLEDLRFAVFGLGDSSYPKYNWVGRKLFRRLLALGANPIADRGEGDDQNEYGIESTFPKWLDHLFASIDTLCPAAPSFVPLSIDVVPPARVRLVPVPTQSDELIPGSSSSSRTKSASAPTILPWSKDNALATVTRLDRFTSDTWFQDVRNFELEIKGGTSYAAGDVLEIRPQNSCTDVQKFLDTVGWSSIADELYDLTPTSPDQPLPPHLPSPFRTTIRHLLTHELDIESVPRVSFFEWLAGFNTGDLEEKLRYFCSGEGQDDLIEYTHRPRRTISEVLHEFRSGKIPAEYIMDLLPPLRARGFSIASSSKMQPGQVDLLVAIVAYKTILSTPRKGVCTSYISRLSLGDTLSVRFTTGILKLPPVQIPLIMIGPGTGVAPFRALMAERFLSGATQNLLFFGCRSIKEDFYYQSEWEKYVSSGFLTLSVAASRDQEEKIYVQHRLKELGELVWLYLSLGGIVYLCGSATSMPAAVKRAFLFIFEQYGGMGEEEKREKYWDRLEKEGRLIEETWA